MADKSQAFLSVYGKFIEGFWGFAFMWVFCFGIHFAPQEKEKSNPFGGMPSVT